MPDIFLSYTTADKTRIAPIARQLEALGYDVWWDVDIPPGKRWEQVILGTLEDSKAVVVVWTEASILSEWVYEEADYGKRKNILIPVILDDCQPPMGFRMRQGARLVGWTEDTSTKEWQGILKSLESLLGPAPAMQAKSTPEQTADEFEWEDEDFLHEDDDDQGDESNDSAENSVTIAQFNEFLSSIKMPRKGADTRQDLAISLEEAFSGTEVDVEVDDPSRPRRLRVKIPRGIEDGSRIRLRGEGALGTDGGATGDLHLFVSVAPHPAFEREDDNLYAQASVPVTKAILGGDVIVHTLDGEFTLHVPAGTQGGQRFHIPGRGMSKLNSETRGDLYVEVAIEIPRELSGHARNLVYRLAQLLKV